MKIQPPLKRPMATRIPPQIRLEISMPPQKPSHVLPGLTSGASFRLPPSSPGALAGVVLHHAAVVLDDAGPALVTNAVPLLLAP